MTNEEAAKMLTAKVECMERENSGTDLDCNFRNCDECDLCYAQGTMGEQREALKVAIDAIEKQIPKKAVGEHYTHMRCPSCNHRIPSGMGSSSRRRDNWCNYCGQAISWEEE